MRLVANLVPILDRLTLNQKIKGQPLWISDFVVARFRIALVGRINGNEKNSKLSLIETAEGMTVMIQ